MFSSLALLTLALTISLAEVGAFKAITVAVRVDPKSAPAALKLVFELVFELGLEFGFMLVDLVPDMLVAFFGAGAALFLSGFFDSSLFATFTTFDPATCAEPK